VEELLILRLVAAYQAGDVRFVGSAGQERYPRSEGGDKSTIKCPPPDFSSLLETLFVKKALALVFGGYVICPTVAEVYVRLDDQVKSQISPGNRCT